MRTFLSLPARARLSPPAAHRRFHRSRDAFRLRPRRTSDASRGPPSRRPSSSEDERTTMRGNDTARATFFSLALRVHAFAELGRVAFRGRRRLRRVFLAERLLELRRTRRGRDGGGEGVVGSERARGRDDGRRRARGRRRRRCANERMDGRTDGARAPRASTRACPPASSTRPRARTPAAASRGRASVPRARRPPCPPRRRGETLTRRTRRGDVEIDGNARRTEAKTQTRSRRP